MNAYLTAFILALAVMALGGMIGTEVVCHGFYGRP